VHGEPVIADSPSDAATGGARVLVADDHHDSAESFAMLLRILGKYDVRNSFDGVATIAAAEEFRPDAMLLDIGMPGMSGYEVAREIRAREWGADVLLIAVTGWGQEEQRKLTAEAGFDHHFVKPVHPRTLIPIIDAHVQERRAR
jgi:DNA-binding response OmpR family regulator